MWRYLTHLEKGGVWRRPRSFGQEMWFFQSPVWQPWCLTGTGMVWFMDMGAQMLKYVSGFYNMIFPKATFSWKFQNTNGYYYCYLSVWVKLSSLWNKLVVCLWGAKGPQRVLQKSSRGHQQTRGSISRTLSTKWQNVYLFVMSKADSYQVGVCSLIWEPRL